MTRKISIFSFFSGVGILDLAFENCDYEIVLVNEFDERFLEAYKYSRKMLNIADPIYGYDNCSAEKYAKGKGKKKLIQWINEERHKGNLVGFIGGPPCPDFSVAGKNAGSTGKNGRLTKTYFDLVCRCKPDFFLFENVKGLVRTEKHKAFYYEMQRKVDANNYVINDRLLNALDYGVPQFRERIFMVGILNSLINNNNKNDTLLNFNWSKYRIYDTERVLTYQWPKTDDYIENSLRPFIYDVPKCLTVEYWFQLNNVISHPNERDIFSVKRSQKFTSIMEGDTKGKSFKRLHRWRFSPTAAYGHNEVHLHPYKARRISVAEAMAIQSIPKEFVLPPENSLSSKFKMIGNGVPYLMAESIAKTLKDFLVEI